MLLECFIAVWNANIGSLIENLILALSENNIPIMTSQ